MEVISGRQTISHYQMRLTVYDDEEVHPTVFDEEELHPKVLAREMPLSTLFPDMHGILLEAHFQKVHLVIFDGVRFEKMTGLVGLLKHTFHLIQYSAFGSTPY